jgi:hypothetical protein
MSEVSECPTICCRLCAQHLVLALDVGIEKLDEVEMIWELLPSEQIVYPVLVSDMTLASDVGKRLDIGVDRREQEPEIRDIATGYLG